MCEKLMSLSGDYELKLVLIPSRELLTLELHAMYPHAQHPRWQRITQITAEPHKIWEIGSFLHSGTRLEIAK